jgi:uncharacterized protein (DUF433 family)
MTELDWSKCEDVESVPGRCGGAWVAKDSRVMVAGILANAEDASPEEVAGMFELPVEQVRRILDFASPTPAAPETIYIEPICDRCKDVEASGFGWQEEKDAAPCLYDDCPNKPVVYIRADLFEAKIDEIMENARVYDAERELFISRLVSLLIRAREATDDHALFSDIGAALPNLGPPER